MPVSTHVSVGPSMAVLCRALAGVCTQRQRELGDLAKTGLMICRESFEGA
ncbi:hypothetical protein [Dactylosporangium sp. CA-092794]